MQKVISGILFSKIMRVFLHALLLVSWSCLRANQIDQLQTKADVLRFLSEQFHLEYIFEVKAASHDTAAIVAFHRTDLNGDRLTDLVVSGEWVIVVMDRGNGKFLLDQLGWAPFDFAKSLKAIVTVEERKLLILGNKKQRNGDTLAYRAEAGGFMEYNKYPMEKIELDSFRIIVGPCYGNCPVYDMAVFPDRSVLLDGQKTALSIAQYDTLLAILKYLPLEQLKLKYEVSWTDDRSFSTEFSIHSKFKKIFDYGGIGSFGLHRLYEFCDDLVAALSYADGIQRHLR